MAWWKRNDVVLNADTECYYCRRNVGDDHIIPIGSNARRGRTITYAVRVCFSCFVQEEAITEAQDKSWRFSEVDFFELCICGRAKVLALGHCYTCAKERRMLGHQAAELKRCRRILTEIRKEVRSSERGEKTIDGDPSRNAHGSA